MISLCVQWHAVNNPCLVDYAGSLPKLHSQMELPHFSELSLFSQYRVEKAGRLGFMDVPTYSSVVNSSNTFTRHCKVEFYFAGLLTSDVDKTSYFLADTEFHYV